MCNFLIFSVDEHYSPSPQPSSRRRGGRNEVEIGSHLFAFLSIYLPYHCQYFCPGCPQKRRCVEPSFFLTTLMPDILVTSGRQHLKSIDSQYCCHRKFLKGTPLKINLTGLRRPVRFFMNSGERMLMTTPLKNHQFITTLFNLRGNARACVYTEPLWGIPYNLFQRNY